MGNNEITINGVSLASMGTTLLSGAYSALLTPPALKDFVENNDPLKDGTEVIVPGTDGEDDTSTPKLKERDVTLTFLIQGESETVFFDNYNAFVAMLHRGMINLYIPELGRNFSLIYSNSTQFANYMLNACKLAVKFREPNPTPQYIKVEKPNVPADQDTTTDALGIELYNTPVLYQEGEGIIKVSAPISIYPELASFTKVIDGQTICYYNREAILNIFNIITNKYMIPNDMVADAIFMMLFTGLASQPPADNRTVWQIIIDEDGMFKRGNAIVKYPQMGYFKNGAWYSGDTVFISGESNIVKISNIKENGDWEEEILLGDDIAIPMKLLITLENGASMASTMSLLRSRR